MDTSVKPPTQDQNKTSHAEGEKDKPASFSELSEALTPQQMRILKVMVVTSVILLIGGFTTLTGVIVYKVFSSGENTAAISSQQTSQDVSSQSISDTLTELPIPSNAKIQSWQIADGQIVIHYAVENTQHFLAIDSRTGDIQRRFVIKQ